jgi:cytochrome c biogenesis protein
MFFNFIMANKSTLLIRFLGSMNLAVTLLVMLAVASVIGTVLKQNQAFQDYIIKFGPFWTQVFDSLGLFHVYGAAWFILVLVFLLISTGVCLTKNSPKFIKDMKNFSESLSLNSYKNQPYSETIALANFDLEGAKKILTEQGFKTKIHQRKDGVTIAAMKGKWNRLGYIFTHSSIIIICISALLDSNLLLKFRELTGDLVAETRSVSLNEIPKKSWLGEDNFSFRGTVNVAEGQKTNVLFLPYERGFLVQKLPFSIKVKEFRIEHYDTGMPKSFESDLILNDPNLEQPIKKTIRVNEPLYYKNYAIYQSSFGDGGSILDLKIYPLLSPEPNSIEIQTAISRVEPLKTPLGVFKVEFNDFRAFNIIPTTEAERKKTGKKTHNNGPSITFKVRNEQGKAWEYESFMQPTLQDNRYFFMTGMRTSSAEPFRYLFIPVDEKNSSKRFFKFLAIINNPIKIKKLLNLYIPKIDSIDNKTYNLQLQLFTKLLVLFRKKGFQGINLFVQTNIPKEEQEKVKDYYLEKTSLALQTLYLSILYQDEQNKDSISEFNEQWFEDAIIAISSLTRYGPAMYFELVSFKQIDSSGLQITKSPGKDIVYFGSSLLIIGVFFLFYLRQKRIWLAYSVTDKSLIVAGKDSRDLPETKKEFAKMIAIIKQKL